MRTPMLFILLSFTQILLVTVLPSVSADLVDYTCKKTPYPVFCSMALRLDPWSTTADTKTLGLIMVDKVEARAKSTVTKIKHLRLDDEGGIDLLRAGVQNHHKRYGAPSKQALTKGGYKFAVEYMNAAANDASECEAGFGGSKSAISDSNNYEHKAATVASAIAGLLL